MRSTIFLLLGAAACADPISPAGPDAGDDLPPGKVETTRNADGSYTTRIDATDAESWTALAFATGEEIDGDGWDLSAQRFHLKLNGGVSGDGGVEVAPLPGAAFADVTAPPSSGWITDAPDGDDDDAEPDYAFEQGDGWYAYDPATHVLTPRDVVWVIRTVDGAHLKLVIDGYYDDAGTAGVFTTTWAPLDGGGS